MATWAEQLQQMLKQFDSDTGTAECHGMLAGWLCAAPTLNVQDWVDSMAHELSADGRLPKEAVDALSAAHASVYEGLNGPLLDFHPLLPGDETPLPDRVLALGDWCRGFLYGLSLGDMHDIDQLPEDSREALNDMLEFSRTDKLASDSLGTEDDEEDYSVLLEYLRTAVLLMNEEINPHRAAPQTHSPLH
jgi:yecA family protein